MILHTFGDSHRFSCLVQDSSITLVKAAKNPGLGTMAKFGTEKLAFINIKNYEVNEGDAVCFCFGEIDCRSHFCKPQNFKIYKELINEMVSRYFEAIKLNAEQYKKITVLIFNVVPAIKKDTQKYQHPKFPHVGTDEERKTVVLYMNSKLKEYCQKYDYIFLDVYDKYCGIDGLFNPELSDGTVHIGNFKYVSEFLKNI